MSRGRRRSRTSERLRPSAPAVAGAQAVYYLPTALLPFISRRRFEALTGPKLEWWLVLTVGTQVGVIGTVLGLAARHPAVSPEIRVLGAGAAGGLAAIDIVYVARRRISPVYLLDALVELGVLAGWLSCRPKSSA